MPIRHLPALLLLTCTTPAAAQQPQPVVVPPSAQAAAPLQVGLVELEPLSYSKDESIYQGLAVELWETVAGQCDIAFDYVPFGSSDSAQMALDAGTLDVFLTATPSTGSSDSSSHSPIYYTSSLAVAYRGNNQFVDVITGLFQPAFFQILAGLCVLLLIIGTMMYFVERKENEDQFGGKALHGIGAGFWWAGVTLTTIGYGDKAPITLFGRIVAMLWMLVGLAVSATLTAAIVNLANAGGKQAKVPGDLYESTNVIAEDHHLLPVLDKLSVPYTVVPKLSDGMKQVANEEADYVVANEMEIDYYLTNSSRNLSVQGSRLDPNYFTLGFRQNLPEADSINASLQRVTLSNTWVDWLNEFVPN